ncbi:MAG: metallophosphoesterase, partial [Lentisphaeria bacterium]|nr:metallophosphoesterase [Lentisphaeria bacterium]
MPVKKRDGRRFFSVFYSLFPAGEFRQRCFFAFLLSVSVILSPLFAAETDNAIRIRIIQTTDIHGQYSSFAKPGITELAHLVTEAREEAGENNTLYIDCGDLFQGTFESSLDKGGMMIHALNLLKCDAFIPGNHDLDFGLDSLQKNLHSFRGKILSCSWRFRSPQAPEI